MCTAFEWGDIEVFVCSACLVVIAPNIQALCTHGSSPERPRVCAASQNTCPRTLVAALFCWGDVWWLQHVAPLRGAGSSCAVGEEVLVLLLAAGWQGCPPQLCGVSTPMRQLLAQCVLHPHGLTGMCSACGHSWLVGACGGLCVWCNLCGPLAAQPPGACSVQTATAGCMQGDASLAPQGQHTVRLVGSSTCPPAPLCLECVVLVAGPGFRLFFCHSRLLLAQRHGPHGASKHIRSLAWGRSPLVQCHTAPRRTNT